LNNRGSPAYARIGGLRSPARRTLGSDIAGGVDDVGNGVNRFRVGDEVYGDNLARKGGFAEHAAVPESALALKPSNLSFAEASTIPQPGAIALQGTRWAKTGDRVLINGAGGGSGSFAIQLAKQAGVQVTGVDNAGKLDFMRSLGADEVLDYTGTTSLELPSPTTWSLTWSHTGRSTATGARSPAADGIAVWVVRSTRSCGCSLPGGCSAWPAAAPSGCSR
jgi:NADPH:quinone reductase-like Zn-dependent oxidoreductase